MTKSRLRIKGSWPPVIGNISMNACCFHWEQFLSTSFMNDCWFSEFKNVFHDIWSNFQLFIMCHFPYCVQTVSYNKTLQNRKWFLWMNKHRNVSIAYCFCCCCCRLDFNGRPQLEEIYSISCISHKKMYLNLNLWLGPVKWNISNSWVHVASAIKWT